MWLVTLVSALLLAQAPQPPAVPSPVEGDFIIRDFRFTSGETLPTKA